MAPEQWAGKKQGSYTDQYALACVIYELVSGGVPFESVFKTGDSTLMMNCVESRMPDKPKELTKKQWNALKKGLVKDPAQRHETCAGLIAAVSGEKKNSRRDIKQTQQKRK